MYYLKKKYIQKYYFIVLQVKKRIMWLDAIKGYAIFMVMLSHILPYNDILGFLYSGYMPLFFISSGFTDKGDLTSMYLVKKTKRLLIPYIFYGIIGVLLFTFFKKGDVYQGGKVHEWIGLLYARFCLYPYGTINNVYFLPIESVSALWFLPALFCGFVSYYFLKQLNERGIPAWLLYGGAIILTMAMYKLPILLPWSLDICLLIALFIFIGTKLKLYLNNYVLGWKSVLVMVFFIVVAYKNGCVNMSVRQFGCLGGQVSLFMLIIIGMMYFVSLFVLFRILPHKIVELFAYLGRLSLRLMCIQMPLFFILSKILSHYDLNSGIWSLLMKLIAVLIIAQVLEIIFSMLKTNVRIVKYL